MDGVRIIDFDGKKHLRDVISLCEKNIPDDMHGLETVSQSFKWISIAQRSWLANMFLNVFSPVIEGVNTKRILQYVVALDKNGKVVGVSGAYSVTGGYARKIGIYSAATDKISIIKDRKNIWLGWMAVAPEFRGCGLGTELIKESVGKALGILRKENLDDKYLLVVSDKSAVEFYKKLGMEVKIEQGGTIICGMKIDEIKKKFNI